MGQESKGATDAAAFDAAAFVRSERLNSAEYGPANHLLFCDAALVLGRALFGDAWDRLNWKYASGESERIAREKLWQREMKHLQEIHGLSMSYIQGIDSLTEWDLLMTTTPETLGKYKKEKRDFIDGMFEGSRSEREPPSWPQPVQHRELTAEENAAIAEACSDERNPDKAAAYRQVVTVAMKLRQWLLDGDAVARIELAGGKLLDVPKELWQPENVTLKAIGTCGSLSPNHSGSIRLEIDSERNRVVALASSEASSGHDPAPAEGGQEFRLLIDETRFVAALQAEMANLKPVA